MKLRTNWIITIEKLISALNVADKIEDFPKFKEAVKRAIKDGFLDYWINSLSDPTLSRLAFYKKVKTEFGMESFLDKLNFEQRRAITKLRCPYPMDAIVFKTSLSDFALFVLTLQWRIRTLHFPLQ